MNRQDGIQQSYKPLTSAPEESMPSRASEVNAIHDRYGNAAVVAQLTGATPALDPAPAVRAVAQQRLDYVFIIPQDRAGKAALRYFKAHVPNAVFVVSCRNFTGLLQYIQKNVSQPIGNLYIILHGSEDGTLHFGLNAADKDRKTSVQELRSTLHPQNGGPNLLPQLTNQIDDQTRIRIKGCNIGRTPEMVELVDEAFGGEGVVTAPTHKQNYGYDRTLAGTGKLPVTTARQGALAKYKQASAAKQAAEKAGTVEALSGPMFQRPGAMLFTAAELLPEVRTLYPQLRPRQQNDLVQALVAPDRRPEALARKQQTYKQHGQRAYSIEMYRQTLRIPQDLAEARRAFGKEFRKQKFTARELSSESKEVEDGTEWSFHVEGAKAGVGQYVLTFTCRVPSDAALLSLGKNYVSNPNRYEWRVRKTHNTSSGLTELAVIAERVVAYLHDGGLNPSRHQYFTRPESDTNFYATSTFVPPPKAPAQP